VYLRLLIAPVGFCLHDGFDIVRSALDPQVLRGLPLAAALLAGTIIAWRRSTPVFLALAWMVIALIPAAALKFVGRPIAELRAYVPSVGFCLLLGLVLHGLPAVATSALARRRLEMIGLGLCAALVATYSGLTVARTLCWSDRFALWSDTVAKNPRSWHAHQRLAMMYRDRGMTEEAIQHLRVLADMDPHDPAPLADLASLYQRTGQWDGAARCYRRLLQLDPRNVAILVNLGAAHLAMGDPREAARHFGAAARIDPESLAAHYNLGIVHARAGEHAEAAAEYEECVRIDPVHGAAWLALGAQYQELRRRADAAGCYRRCIELGGPQAETASNRLRQLDLEGPS